MPTLTDIVETVRSLCYDRFPISILSVKKNTSLILNVSGDAVSTANPTMSYTIEDSHTLQDLADAFIKNSTTIPVAYLARYRFDEPVKGNLIPITATTANVLVHTPIQVKSFFHNESIVRFIKQYFTIVYDCKTFESDAALDTYIQELNDREIRHLTLFTAILLVEYRRFYEYAATAFSGDIFSDGSGRALTGREGSSSNGDSVSVNIGGVFQLSDNLDEDAEKSNEDISAIGADNSLGDTGFWYKLWNHLRLLLEREFKDFYFRNDDVMHGYTQLDRPLDYLTFFGSWPYTTSPYIRNVR